ncbi:hypothetical protein ACA910_010674 [Epithemia clementina (nom. ined.)]
MTEEGSPRAMAMVEFVGTFASLSGSPPESLSDLSDGVALFEALSEIAPAYFDPTTIARHLGDNWALKSSNLRKLVRNLEDFYHEGLFKDADFESIPLTAIAKEGDADGVASLVELVAAASVTCADKGTFVQRILGMSPDNQVEMKNILEQSLAKLTEYTDDDDEGDENELVFDDDDEEEKLGDAAEEGRGNMFGGAHVNDGMEEELAEARRELSQLKSQTAIANQDNERAQAKLRAVVEDLQDRLVKRQDDLIQLEEDLRNTTTELEDVKSKLAEKETENAQLADDLDVANAKAQQLHKAEATVMAYKKRLEGMGAINQQMTDLEDQAANYLRQIMELETQVKKSAALQKQVHELEEKIKMMEKERETSASSTQNASAEIAELKSSLLASVRAKKQYEEELAELRAKVELGDGGQDAPVASLAASETAQDLEKLTRLKIENEQLQKQVEELKAQQKSLSAAAASTAVASTAPAVASDSEEVSRLKAELEARNKEITKISSDKDKLETYTKRTLAKFQEKYLVALQECKAKLKEKQDKIESLESRSASERTAQKREERLLSSTIYELGLAIMQNRLKER